MGSAALAAFLLLSGRHLRSVAEQAGPPRALRSTALWLTATRFQPSFTVSLWRQLDHPRREPRRQVIATRRA